MDRYGLLGHPVSHSLSPRIHESFAHQSGRVISYELFDVAPGSVAEKVRALADEGYLGLNVTLPHKREAMEAADDVAPLAQLAGAVNTLILQPSGSIRGDNTDGVGLVRDLTRNLRLEIGGAQVLLMGAGGAGRGVIAALLAEGPRSLMLANRDAAKAERVAETFADLGAIHASPYEALAGHRFDIVINATAAGISGQVPPVPRSVIEPHTACYDMAYGKASKPFAAFARELGATAIHQGLGMLVEQAAESFHIWRGVRPDTRSVLQALSADPQP